MVTESDSIQPDEMLLRRVLNQPNVIDFNLKHPLQRLAFRPTNNDIDGLSLFRKLFTTPEKIAMTGTNPSGYYIFEIAAQDIFSIGLTIVPDPQPGQPSGHALIPEINSLSRSDREAERISKKHQQALVDIVNRNIEAALAYNPE